MSDRQDEDVRATRAVRRRGAALIAAVQGAMNQAHRDGFHATGHVLHDALRKVGWELAEKIEKAVSR